MQDNRIILQERFCLERVLGKGGQGCVYLAYDLKLRKYWAVKELYTRSEKEAEIMRSLEHPCLPRIVDILEEQGKRYLVMDYLEGFTLQEIRKKRKHIPWKQRLLWAIQLCILLEYLHGPAKGIIYQDLKPSNILVHVSGDIRLIDFGIAGIKGKGPGSGLGTRGFAAPEQYHGKADEQSDIYSLGAVLRYMEDGDEEKGKWHREWRKIVSGCMAEKPSHRYRSVTRVKKDLLKLEQMRRGRQKVYGGTVLIVMGCLFLLESRVSEQERMLDAGVLLTGKEGGELADTADYETARQYFSKGKGKLNSTERYMEILRELEKDTDKADWKKVKTSLEKLENTNGSSWEKGRERVFLANIYQAYAEEMGYSEKEGLGKAAALLESARKLVELNAGEVFAPVYRVEILRRLAKNYERQGKNKESLKLYLELLEKEPPEAIRREAFMALASLYRRQKEYEKAENYYEKCLEEFPKDAEIYCAYALMEALERGNLHKGETLMEQMKTNGAAGEGFNSEKVERLLQKLREEEAE